MRHQPGYLSLTDVHAFAEGRRLRERSPHRVHHGRDHRPGPHRLRRRSSRRPARRVTPGLVLLAIPAAVVVGTTVGILAIVLTLAGLYVLLHALPLLLVGGVAVAVTRRARRRTRRVAAAGTAPVPARPAARPRPDLVWTRARERFHRLRSEYAAFECDAMQVLRLPALADVTVPSTARFVDAFAEAQALESDRFPGERHGGEFVAAVDRAERAWRAARDAAERIRLTGFGPAERTTVERIIKLLTTARDSDSEPERLAAYTRARAELAKLDQTGVLHVPLPAQAVLDAAARGQLPARTPEVA